MRVTLYFVRRQKTASNGGLLRSIRGEGAGTRTLNLVIKSHLLYQLSYAPGSTVKYHSVYGAPHPLSKTALWLARDPGHGEARRERGDGSADVFAHPGGVGAGQRRGNERADQTHLGLAK